MPRKDLAARREYGRAYYRARGRMTYLAHKDIWRERSKRFESTHRKARAEKSRVYRLNHPEKIKQANHSHYERNGWRFQLKRHYGISEKEYDALVVKQHGVCAICRKACKVRSRLNVDHDHKTGKIRGLLCHHCNAGMGHFSDNIQRLQAAMKYLRNSECL